MDQRDNLPRRVTSDQKGIQAVFRGEADLERFSQSHCMGQDATFAIALNINQCLMPDIFCEMIDWNLSNVVPHKLDSLFLHKSNETNHKEQTYALTHEFKI